MNFRVLGTIEVAGPSASPTPPGAKERAILARLLVDPGRTVPADALLAAAWDGVPREVAARSLAVRVANLRTFLEPGRERGAPSLLVRDGSGYRLEVPPEQVDAQRFERCVRAARGLPAAAALETLDDALALWRGTPFGDLAEAEFARAEVRRLEGLREQALEARARALVELGRPLEAVDELRRLARSDPLREALVRTLMLALYAAGRQVEALAAYRELAARLRELGLNPAEATRALERRILDNDATLAAPTAAPAAAPAGREPELARLRAALAAAIAGRRAGVMACGEAGAGKSTLVDAFLAAPSGAVAGVGQCLDRRGPGEPYMPVLEALGALARGPAGDAVVAELARRAPTWLVELPWLLGDDASAQAVRQRAQGSTRARMLRELLEALDAVCATVPVVLVLEDLHWADDSTLDMVAALLRRREPARLLLVGTYRPDGRPRVVELVHELGVRGLCEELAVGSLGADAVAAYLELRFPSAPLPARLAETLARRSGGNPLFMRNLLEHWLAGGTLAERGGAVSLARPEGLEAGVPPTLRAHIRDQLERLAPEDAELLAAASVAGRDFSVDTLAAALGRDREAVAAHCATLARRTRLIERRDDGHAFPHDLHREVLYELLPADARARLHARVGAQLADAYGPAAPAMAAELGFHFVAGRDPERAVRFLQLAAQRAFGRNAHAEGIRHLRAALDAAAGLEAGTERTRSEVELLSSLGQALVATGGWSAQEAEESLLRARTLAARLSDNEPLVSVLLALATLYELRGEYTRAHAMALECERLAPSGSSEHELESSELLACNLFHQGSFARALEYAERGVALFDAGAPGGYATFPATLGDNAGVSCHDWAGLALWFLGRPDSALARASRAVELARDPSRTYSLATARAQMAVVHQCRREPEPALEWAEATIAAARQLGYVYREAMGRVLRGWALGLMGDPAQGVREISAGLAASRGTGARMDDPHYLALLAEAHLRAGDAEAGLAAVAQALELARRERSLFYEPELHRIEGALHAVAGRAGAAEECLRRGFARAREQGSRALELRIATDLARLLPDPAAAAEARAAVAAAHASFDEGFETRDLREAAAVLGPAPQAITAAPASASTSAPNSTR